MTEATKDLHVAPSGTLFRHKRRGCCYRVLCDVAGTPSFMSRPQCAVAFTAVHVTATSPETSVSVYIYDSWIPWTRLPYTCVLYVSLSTGVLYIRAASEFNDGRFEPLVALPEVHAECNAAANETQARVEALEAEVARLNQCDEQRIRSFEFVTGARNVAKAQLAATRAELAQLKAALTRSATPPAHLVAGTPQIGDPVLCFVCQRNIAGDASAIGNGHLFYTTANPFPAYGLQPRCDNCRRATAFVRDSSFATPDDLARFCYARGKQLAEDGTGK